MGLLKEFKEFAVRGNVIDLAVAVIIGAAFGKIVTTFTEGIIMPFVGLVTGGVDFKSKFYDLSGKIGPWRVEVVDMDGKRIDKVLVSHVINEERPDEL